MAAIAIQSKGLKDLGSTPETSLLLTMASMHTHRKMNILQLEVPILKPRARIIPSELANKGSQSSPSPRARRVLDCDERIGLPSSKQGTYTSAVNSISRLHTGRLRRAEIRQPQRELRRSETARLRYPTSPGLSAERQLTGPASSATRDAKMDPQRPNLMNEIINQAVGGEGTQINGQERNLGLKPIGKMLPPVGGSRVGKSGRAAAELDENGKKGDASVVPGPGGPSQEWRHSQYGTPFLKQSFCQQLCKPRSHRAFD